MGPRVTKSLSPADRALADFVATFYADPLGFVQACYPWGEPGPLAQHTGPDTWQAQQLAGIGADVRAHAFNGHDPVPAIRRVTSSGHGIGKSFFSSAFPLRHMAKRENEFKMKVFIDGRNC